MVESNSHTTAFKYSKKYFKISTKQDYAANLNPETLKSSLLPEIVRILPLLGVPGLATASHPEIRLKRVRCWSDSLRFGRNRDFKSGRGCVEEEAVVGTEGLKTK